MADRGHGCMQCAKWMVWLCRFSGFLSGVSYALLWAALRVPCARIVVSNASINTSINWRLLKSYGRLVSFRIKVKNKEPFLNSCRCTSLFRRDAAPDSLPRFDWQGGKGHSAWNNPIRREEGVGCLRATAGFEIQTRHNGRPKKG